MIAIRSSVLALAVTAIAATSCGKQDQELAGRSGSNSAPAANGGMAQAQLQIRPVRPDPSPTVSRTAKRFESRNCSSGTGKREISVSDLMKGEVSIDDRASVGGEVGIEIPAAVKASLRAEVERGYRTTVERTFGASHKIEVAMRPWTIVTTEIEVEKKEFTSAIEFETDGKVSRVPYRFTVQAPDLSTVINKSIPCPGQPTALELSPAHLTLEAGESGQLRATLLDSRNNAIADATFSWQSSDNNVATVTKDGAVRAVGRGETTITATAGGGEISGRAGILVTQTVARVQIEPANPSVAYGKSLRLTATAVDNRGNVLARELRWSSGDEDIATVSPRGLVEGAWIGRATIKATTAEGVTGSAEITIGVPAIAFPSKEITLIVPFSPGGSSDQIARVVARSLAAVVRQAVVVSNMPGDNGAKGWWFAARARPDGYTLAIYTDRLIASGAGGQFDPIAMISRRYGLLAPKGTLKERLVVLDDAVRKAMDDKSLKEALVRMDEPPYYLEAPKFSRKIGR